jgi:hypothetical protein
MLADDEINLTIFEIGPDKKNFRSRDFFRIDSTVVAFGALTCCPKLRRLHRSVHRRSGPNSEFRWKYIDVRFRYTDLVQSSLGTPKIKFELNFFCKIFKSSSTNFDLPVISNFIF